MTLLLAALALRQPLTGFKTATYGWFLLLALIPQLLGHSSFNWALRHLPAAYVAVATLGEPVGAAFLAFLLLGETPSVLKIGGRGPDHGRNFSGPAAAVQTRQGTKTTH